MQGRAEMKRPRKPPPKYASSPPAVPIVVGGRATKRARRITPHASLDEPTGPCDIPSMSECPHATGPAPRAAVVTPEADLEEGHVETSEAAPPPPRSAARKPARKPHADAPAAAGPPALAKVAKRARGAEAKSRGEAQTIMSTHLSKDNIADLAGLAFQMGVDAVVEDPNVKSAFFTLMPADAPEELKVDLLEKLLDKFFHQARLDLTSIRLLHVCIAAGVYSTLLV